MHYDYIYSSLYHEIDGKISYDNQIALHCIIPFVITDKQNVTVDPKNTIQLFTL